MNNQQEGCVKCGHCQASERRVSMSGSGLSKMFDIEHNNFIAITCENCGYTEFYSDVNNRGMDFLDLFFS